MTRRRMADLDDIASLRDEVPDVFSIALALAFLVIAVASPHLLLLAGLVVLVTNLLRPAVHALLEADERARHRPAMKLAICMGFWRIITAQDPWLSFQQLGIGCLLGAALGAGASRAIDNFI